MGKYIQTNYKQYITESVDDDYDDENEVDYDEVADLMKNHGWGDLSHMRYEEFEESTYYSGTTNDEQYAEEFHKYMYAVSTGDID